uniref:BTB domain-containing protein n=1 Tax=Panagrolaimus davidi TaxID=227884 RepID=A0A914PWM0_9BILA
MDFFIVLKSEAIEKLVHRPTFAKFRLLQLYDTRENFDLEAFDGFIKKNSIVTFCFDFYGVSSTYDKEIAQMEENLCRKYRSQISALTPTPNATVLDAAVAAIIDPLNFQIPIALKWIIKKEDVEKRSFINTASQYLIPSLPGVFLRFSLFKEGDEGDVDKGPEKRVRSNIQYRVHSEKFVRWALGEHVQKGFYISSFTTQTDLLNPEKNFFVDGNLILDITGIISVDREDFKDIERPFIFEFDVEMINADLEERDFSIFVEGKEIKVHKNIMSEVSPVFAAMFQSKMKETIENKMDLIKFDFNTVEFAIELCYGKKILENLDLNFCTELLRFSDKYDIQKVREQIEVEIRPKITCLNVVEIANSF